MSAVTALSAGPPLKLIPELGVPTSPDGKQWSSEEEVEFKYRVSGDRDHSAIAKIAGSPGSRAEQISLFFDTPDRDLFGAGCQLRLATEKSREFDGLWLITAKGCCREGARQKGLMKRFEEEISIPEAVAQQVISGRLSPLAVLEANPELTGTGRKFLDEFRARLTGKPITLVGFFENERMRVPVKLPFKASTLDVVLELDRTVFPGNRVHHEVEMDVPRGVDPSLAEQALRRLFRQANVRAVPSSPKADRLFRILGAPAPPPMGKVPLRRWWRKLVPSS